MDPITTAIVAALTAGVAGAVTDIGKQALVDAYNGVKAVIQRKWGADSELARAVDSLENNPDSPGRQATLQEEVATAAADQDQEFLTAVRALAEKLAAGGDTRIQEMIRSEQGKQFMSGRGGLQEQKMSDSPRGEQRME